MLDLGLIDDLDPIQFLAEVAFEYRQILFAQTVPLRDLLLA